MKGKKIIDDDENHEGGPRNCLQLVDDSVDCCDPLCHFFICFRCDVVHTGEWARDGEPRFVLLLVGLGGHTTPCEVDHTSRLTNVNILHDIDTHARTAKEEEEEEESECVKTKGRRACVGGNRPLGFCSSTAHRP